MSFLRASLFLFFALMSASTIAQQPKVFNDMLTQQTHQALTAVLTVRQDPDIVEANAKAIRALFDALVKEGFSQEQALTLVAASISKDD